MTSVRIVADEIETTIEVPDGVEIDQIIGLLLAGHVRGRGAGTVVIPPSVGTALFVFGDHMARSKTASVTIEQEDGLLPRATLDLSTLHYPESEPTARQVSRWLDAGPEEIPVWQ